LLQQLAAAGAGAGQHNALALQRWKVLQQHGTWRRVQFRACGLGEARQTRAALAK
jgi:hypothetical protein